MKPLFAFTHLHLCIGALLSVTLLFLLFCLHTGAGLDLLCAAEERQLLQRAAAAAGGQLSADGPRSSCTGSSSAGQHSSKLGQDLAGELAQTPTSTCS